MWPDSTKLLPFWRNFKSLAIIVLGGWVFTNWQRIDLIVAIFVIEQIFNAANGQVLNEQSSHLITLDSWTSFDCNNWLLGRLGVSGLVVNVLALHLGEYEFETRWPPPVGTFICWEKIRTVNEDGITCFENVYAATEVVVAYVFS